MALEHDIKAIIEEATKSKYIGKLKVQKEEIAGEDPVWILLLYLDMEQAPLVLAYQGTENQFKEFIYKEMKQRKLQYVSFWTAIQELPEDNIDYSE